MSTIDSTPYRIAVLNAEAPRESRAEVAEQAEQSKAASEARRRRSRRNAIWLKTLDVNTALIPPPPPSLRQGGSA